MIHAFAIEPRLVATWGSRAEYRFIHDKFGLGTPRVLLELPKFSAWKKAVYDAARELQLSDADMKRVEDLFRLFSEHRHRRADATYDGVLSWLANAEAEYGRRPFAGILALENPGGHGAVFVSDQLGPGNSRWALSAGVSIPRSPAAIALALNAMLTHCSELHLVDPHFGPQNARHRRVLEALLDVAAQSAGSLQVIRVHCGDNVSLALFESEAGLMATRLPSTLSVEFVRWKQRAGGDDLHNRYVLTDVGGVQFGTGLDDGRTGETDDVTLMARAQYDLRWNQYAQESGFECVDRPAKVVGTRIRR